MLKVNVIVQLTIILQCIFYFIYVVYGTHAYLIACFLCMPIIFLLTCYQHKLRQTEIAYIISAFFLFAITSLLSKTYPYFISQYNLIYAAVALGTAFALYKIKDIKNLTKSLFFLYSMFLMFVFWDLGIAADEAYNEVFYQSSRNYLSGIIIFLSIGVGVAYIKNNDEQPILIYAISFLFCVLLYGRTGILLSFTLLAFSIFQKNKFASVFLMLVGLVVFFVADGWSYLVEVFTTKTNFSRGFESTRTVMLDEYMTSMNSLENILWGSNFNECCKTIVNFDMNPHNSFIMGHTRYGLLHTIMSLGILLYIFSTKRLEYIVLSSVIYARYALDIMGLFTFYDIYIFLMVFLAYKYKKSLKCSYPKERQYI